MKDKKATSTPRYFRRKALAVAISSVSAAAIGTAQTTHSQELMLEEIIVTATKRSANLQDVPLAITAFGTDDIAKRGLVNMDDYSALVPALSITRRGPGGNSVVFRGIASSGIQFGTKSSSGVYLDEQPITTAGVNPDPHLIDIERLEALSGPQGTLFGEASQSGTLRIITNKPNSDSFSAWIDAGVATVKDGDDLDANISAMVNIPLVKEKLALRLVGFTSEDAGYIDNVLGNSPAGTFNNAANVDDDVNSGNVSGGRAALRWDINEDWRLDATATFQNTEQDGFTNTNLDVGDLEQVRYKEEKSEDDWYQLGLTLEGNLGFADALVSASYFDREWKYDADATDYQTGFQLIGDETEAAFNTAYNTAYDLSFYDFGGDPRGRAFNGEQDTRWSIEARLATPSDSDSRWHGLVGLFYSKVEKEVAYGSFVDGYSDTLAFFYNSYYASLPDRFPSQNGLPPQSWAGRDTDTFFLADYDQDITQQAVFGEVTFDITEQLTITAGGRWFEYEQDFALVQGGLSLGESLDLATDYITTNGTSSISESDFVPKVNLTYNIDDDKLVYFTYSEGFRAGGANVTRPGSVLPKSYDADFLTNFELGAKTTWLDGQIRLNVVAYQMQWDDIQIQANDPIRFSLGILNFPEAEVNGFEVDFAWVPLAGLEISGNYGYIDADISKDAALTGINPANGETVLIADVEEGVRLPLTPDMKASLGAEYSFPQQIFGAAPYIRVDYSHVGDSVNSLDGIESLVRSAPPTKQDAYNTVGLKLGLEGDLWSGSLFVNNLTDERADQFFSNRWTKQRLTINRPRTIGVSFKFKFE